MKNQSREDRKNIHKIEFRAQIELGAVTTYVPSPYPKSPSDTIPPLIGYFVSSIFTVLMYGVPPLCGVASILIKYTPLANLAASNLA